MPKGIPNSPEMYGIYSRSWGFEVSIVRNGQRHRAVFGEASHGGLAPALKHAQTWRDAVVQRLPPAPRRARAQKLRADNTTGMPGVFRLLAPNGRLLGWLAKTYIAHDQILRALFPASGADQRARAMAVHERGLQLTRMTGLATVHPAEEAIRKAPAASTAGLPPKLSRSEVIRRTNTSGVSGVAFKSPRPGHPGYWMAITYSVGKGTTSKAFSIAEHGNDKARALAIAERRRQLEDKRAGH